MSIFSDANPPIIVRNIYTPGHRAYIRSALAKRKIELEVGMTLYHSEITRMVTANRRRVLRDTGETGIYTDQLSVRNLYHFFDRRRTHDSRMQILDCYEQLLKEPPGLVTLH